MKTKANLLAVGIFLAAVFNGFGQPIITNQLQNQTNIAGTTATFTVEAAGKDQLRVWAPRRNPRRMQAQDAKN